MQRARREGGRGQPAGGRAGAAAGRQPQPARPQPGAAARRSARNGAAVADGRLRSTLTDLFGFLGDRRPADSTPAAAHRASVTNAAERQSSDQVACRSSSRCLQTHDKPALLDLGPVVGSNVTFFGEQLGCRIRVEDIATDIDGTSRTAPPTSCRRSSRSGSRSRRHGGRHPVLGRARLPRSAGRAGAGDGADDAAASRRARCSASSAPPRRRGRSTRSTWSSMTRHLRYRTYPASRAPAAQPAQPATSSSCSRACASPTRS